jgi:WD40 repeat protein
MKNIITLIFTVFIGAVTTPISVAQVRDCPNPTPIEHIDSALWRLYYFNRQDDRLELLYTDQHGHHWTNYSTNNSIVGAYFSPDRQHLAISTREDGKNRLEIVDLEGNLTSNLLMDIEHPVTGAAFLGWQDDETLLFQHTETRLLIILKYKTENVILNLYPLLDDLPKEHVHSLRFSPDLDFVIYPTLGRDSTENNLFVLRDVGTLGLITSIEARWVAWAPDSGSVFALKADGSISLYNRQGEQIKALMAPNEMTPIMANFSPSGETLVLAGWPGQNGRQVFPSTMFAVHSNVEGFRDICVYATLHPIRIGNFNEQVGLWSPDSSMFAFHVGSSILILNVAEYSISTIGLEQQPVGIIGWAEIPAIND